MAKIVILDWQRGKNMKRVLEERGYKITTANLAVLMTLVANEERIPLEEVFNILSAANDFDPALHGQSQEQNLKEIGF